MKNLIKSLALGTALLVLGASVYAGPGTPEAFARIKERTVAKSDSLAAHERLPQASRRYEMSRRLAWAEAQKSRTADTEIAVFETAKPAYRPVKR